MLVTVAEAAERNLPVAVEKGAETMRRVHKHACSQGPRFGQADAYLPVAVEERAERLPVRVDRPRPVARDVAAAGVVPHHERGERQPEAEARERRDHVLAARELAPGHKDVRLSAERGDEHADDVRLAASPVERRPPPSERRRELERSDEHRDAARHHVREDNEPAQRRVQARQDSLPQAKQAVIDPDDAHDPCEHRNRADRRGD